MSFVSVKRRIDRFMANPGIRVNGLIITINLIIQISDNIEDSSLIVGSSEYGLS